MPFEREQREALHLLEGIENGSLSTTAASHLIDEADPALVYLIVTWLRSVYADHPASEGVLGRLVELTSSRASVDAKIREGKSDPVVHWFEEEHSYRAFTASEFIELIVEKLEG